MKTFLISLLGLLLIGCTKTFNYPTERVEEFPITASDSGNPYQIYIALPESYDEEKADAYPVIYLLDADWDFDRVALEAENQMIKNQDAPIIVGIGYPDEENKRNRDYTPTNKVWEDSGGADQFIDFIQNDLIPTIETRYNVRTTKDQRLIIGHSLGGLLGAYLFITRNDLFGNYLILSPSLWWDEQVFFQKEAELRPTIQNNSHNIFLGIGEMEPFGMNPVLELFASRLKEHYPNVNFVKWRVEGKGHNDSKPENLERGLQFFFQNL